jgi:hypothetical protein
MGMASDSSGYLPGCVIPYVGGIVPGKKAAARSSCGCYLRNSMLPSMFGSTH